MAGQALLHSLLSAAFTTMGDYGISPPIYRKDTNANTYTIGHHFPSSRHSFFIHYSFGVRMGIELLEYLYLLDYIYTSI